MSNILPHCFNPILRKYLFINIVKIRYRHNFYCDKLDQSFSIFNVVIHLYGTIP